MPKRRTGHPPRINIRVTGHLRAKLDKLAALNHLRLSDYVRVQLEEVVRKQGLATGTALDAQRESLAATGGQS